MDRWKAIIFDFDGTLLDSTREGIGRFTKIAVSLGLKVTDVMRAEARAIWGMPGHVMVERFWPDMHTAIFMHAWEEYDCVNQINLFPGVKETIETLSRLLSLSILTSRSHSAPVQLRLHGMEEYFDSICTINDCPAPKPDPRSMEPLLAHYAQLDIKKDHLLLVGDSVHSDYGLARAAQMDFIALTWGNNSREDFLNARLDDRCIIDTIEDLPHIIMS